MTMKSIALMLTAVWISLVPGVRAEAVDWRIDPEHLSVAFDVDHIGFQRQIGMFTEAGGSFRFDPETGDFHSGRFTVQADSVFTAHEERDSHLRNDDFLDTENHPEIVFEATGYAPDGADGGTLTGALTLLGRTREVALDVTLNKRADYPFGHGKETLGVSASTTIRRSEWGMDYAVANGLVGDDVALRFEFEAIRQ